MMEKQLIPAGYKQTEVGVIPEDWACAESNEIMSFFGGYGFASNLSMPTGIRWLKIANVGLNEIKWDAASFLPERLVNEYKDYLLNPSDVVMALTRPILNDNLKVSRIKETDVPAFLNQRVAKIITKSYHQLDYLYYVVQRLNFVAAMNLAMAGTDPPNIGTNTLGKIKVAIPPTKEEQTAIANALSDVDALVAALEKLINKKSAIKTAAMQQLLTGKKRLPPFDQLNTGYKQTELGEIPGDWEVYTVSELINSTQLGGNYANSERETNYPLVKMGNLDRGKIKLDKVEYIIGTPNLNDLLQYGDVLFNTRNTLELVGKVAIWRDELGEAYFNSNLMRFNFNKELVSSSFYMNSAMNTKQFVAALSGIATGTTSVAAIYTKDLLNLKIILPARLEQTAIANVISDMDKDLEALQERLHKTQQIKQGMMQELLTGKTRLLSN